MSYRETPGLYPETEAAFFTRNVVRPMTSFVTSADGTRIAFDRVGRGSPVVVVGGILCDRQTTRSLAERLAERFTVINYDRRGRGESADTAPYGVAREVEDLQALLAAAGGVAAVYGHSSGAGLALHAAAGGLPVTRLVLHEPPYGPDDEASTRSARELAERVRAAVAEDRRADAIALFFEASGLPPEVVEAARADPRLRGLAPTMPYDFEVMGDTDRGGTIPDALVRAVRVPTLVLAGGASPDFFRDTAARLSALLPAGRLTVLEGQDHGAPADAVAPAVAAFLTAESPQERAGAGDVAVRNVVDEYLARLPEAQRATLERLRQTIRSAAPGAEEVIRTGVPAFRYHGKPLVSIGAARRHVALYVMYGAALREHRDALRAYDTSNTVVRFPPDEPPPAHLVAALVKARMAEIDAARRPSRQRRFSRTSADA